jgi:uncharacterized iron-regulated protein
VTLRSSQDAHRRASAPLSVFLLSIGCAGTPIATSPSTPESHVRDEAETNASAPASDGPLKARRSADGTELSEEELIDELARADLICAGESHDDSVHHRIQARLLERLAHRAREGDRTIALGLEMLPRSLQSPLDRYLDGDTDEATFLDETEWNHTWGFAFQLYRPVFETARQSNLRAVALNAERDIVRRVAQEGVGGLDPREREGLPELGLDDAEHRRAFEEAMRDHPVTGQTFDHMYEAQLVWDETMADRAARWLVSTPGGQLFVIAGRHHCARPAIVRRVERRSNVRAVSLDLGSPELADDAAPSTTFDFEVGFTQAP